jgi:hypothetical protein
MMAMQDYEDTSSCIKDAMEYIDVLRERINKKEDEMLSNGAPVTSVDIIREILKADIDVDQKICILNGLINK